MMEILFPHVSVRSRFKYWFVKGFFLIKKINLQRFWDKALDTTIFREANTNFLDNRLPLAI